LLVEVLFEVFPRSKEKDRFRNLSPKYGHKHDECL